VIADCGKEVWLKQILFEKFTRFDGVFFAIMTKTIEKIAETNYFIVIFTLENCL
jgi:hypothetical protein